jgi:Ras family
VLVYDVTSKASFDSIKAIHAEVRRKGRPSRPVVIVGNKSDDADEREVTEAVGRKLARDLRCRFGEVSARDGTGLDELFLELATQINNGKKREARLTASMNCQNLGRAFVAALVKLSAGLEKMHWKILYWMYGPDRPLRVQPMVRPVSHEQDVVRVTSASTSGAKPGILLGGKPHSRGVRKTNVQYSSELMSGGLEITVAEPSSVSAMVHDT